MMYSDRKLLGYEGLSGPGQRELDDERKMVVFERKRAAGAFTRPWRMTKDGWGRVGWLPCDVVMGTTMRETVSAFHLTMFHLSADDD